MNTFFHTSLISGGKYIKLYTENGRIDNKLKASEFICIMRYFLALAAFALIFTSCRRDEPITDPNIRLNFSTDTVFFDTVFTTVGSITERISVFNPYDEPVVIERIRLKNAQGSNFKFNADGLDGTNARDIRIEANDSVFVFIEVTVDPNGGTTPLVVEDQLLFETTGGIQDVDLVAWGQDAYFYPSVSFSGGLEYELPTDKPNVFYGYSIVDTGVTLNIPCGARVHFHSQSGLLVGHEASLKVIGCQDDPVVIQGDRLEDYFKEVPGQWGQIALTQTSKDSEFRNVIIKNGSLGLSVGFTVNTSVETRPNVILENVQILNMSYIGLVGIDGDISATNTVIANCGDHTVALAFGGRYDFTHCTFANYWSGNPRSKPILFLANVSESSEGQVLERDLNTTFTNCIIHGTLEEELEFAEVEGKDFNYLFDHAIIRTEELPEDMENYNEVIFDTPENADLGNLFENSSENDYRLDTNSAAINQGKPTDVTLDLDGNVRDATPDLGAYEFN